MFSVRHLVLALLIGSFIAASSTQAHAQENEDAQAYWYVMTWRLDSFSKLDSLRSQVSRYQKGIVEENRRQNSPILDEIVLFHHTGDARDFNVLIMQKHASWAALDNQGLTSDEILQVVIPDDAERQQFRTTEDWIFEGGQHADHIMIDPVGLME